SKSAAVVTVDAPLAIDAQPADAGLRAGAVEGQVAIASASGFTPVAGATVSIRGGPSTTTDANGRFVLTGAPAVAGLVRHLSSAHGTTAVTLPPEAAVTLGTYLLRGCSAEVSGAAGGTVDVHPCGGEGSAAIVFPAASIARATGEIVAGPVRVELAALDPTDA